MIGFTESIHYIGVFQDVLDTTPAGYGPARFLIRHVNKTGAAPIPAAGYLAHEADSDLAQPNREDYFAIKATTADEPRARLHG
jgi:hypothetical protein